MDASADMRAPAAKRCAWFAAVEISDGLANVLILSDERTKN